MNQYIIIKLSTISSLILSLLCNENIFFMVGTVGYLLDIKTIFVGVALFLLCVDFIMWGVIE